LHRLSWKAPTASSKYGCVHAAPQNPVEREVLDCHDLSHVVLLMLVLNQSVEYYPV